MPTRAVRRAPEEDERSGDGRRAVARTDSVRTDSVRGDSVRGDSIRTESVRGDSSRTDGIRTESVRGDSSRTGGGRAERRSTSSGGYPAGAVPVSALGGRTPGDLDRSASFPEQDPAPTGGSRRSRAAGASGGHAAVPGTRGIEGSGALGSQLVGEVPVHKLAVETGAQSAVSRIDDRPGRSEDRRGGRPDTDRGDRFDETRFDDDRFDEDQIADDRSDGDRLDRDRFDEDRLDRDRFDDDVADDGHDVVPGRFDERRPTRSESRRGARFDADRFDADRDEFPSRLDERRPSRSEDRRGGRSDERRRTMYDEDSGEFRRTRTAVDSGPLSATGSQRGRGVARSRSLMDDGYDDGPRRSKWLWIGGVAAGVAALGAIGGVALLHHSDSPSTVNPAPAASDSLSGPVVRVTKVVDGDTIEVSGPVTGTVEVVGISAPRSDKGQCGATASSAFASRTLAGTNVTLVTDPSQPATDKSGRRLASLRTDNGFDYAVLAAGAGMARYYDGGTPVAQAQDIKNAQAEAEKADRGLWGSPCNGKLSATGSGAASSTASKASTSTEGSTSAENSTSKSSKASSSTEPASTSTSGSTR